MIKLACWFNLDVVPLCTMLDSAVFNRSHHEKDNEINGRKSCRPVKFETREKGLWQNAKNKRKISHFLLVYSMLLYFEKVVHILSELTRSLLNNLKNIVNFHWIHPKSIFDIYKSILDQTFHPWVHFSNFESSILKFQKKCLILRYWSDSFFFLQFSTDGKYAVNSDHHKKTSLIFFLMSEFI